MEYEETVRIILVNSAHQVLLQGIQLESAKTLLFITPGGRVELTDFSLISAAEREITEETGIPTQDINFVSSHPFFSGKQSLIKRGKHMLLTEHFFAARCSSVTKIIASQQQLSDEEKHILICQNWFTVSELQSNSIRYVPVNLHLIVEAIIRGESIPAVDFSHPNK